jgi:small conductance mechanosensitive channel
VLDLNRLVVSLLAGAGVVGLALSFAFQDLATNFISGIFIAFQRPFKTGDWVETNGFLGSVVEIGIRSIKIKTEDGQDVIIPSKEILQKPLKNYISTPERLITLSVGVSYHDDLRKVQKVVTEIIFSQPETDKSKEISVSFYQFGAMSIDFWVKFWVKSGEHHIFLKAQSDAVIAINEAFARNGITIPAAKTGIMLLNDEDSE